MEIGQTELISMLLNLTVVLIMFVTLNKKTKKENQEKLDKKLNCIDFTEYKTDHKREHDKSDKDTQHIRDRVDAIYDHLIKSK